MKTVITSGGYDPIHIGHINMFKAARTLGDELLVILNSDRFLLNKKGYIFMPYTERKQVLSSISYINNIIDCIDKDQSVSNTLQKLSYFLDGSELIFAKGGDKTEDNIPEAKTCVKNNIRMVFGVGGIEKPQSSSWLIDGLISQIKNNSDLLKKLNLKERGKE